MTTSFARRLAASILLACAAPAWAGPLVIAPTTIEVKPGASSAVIEVTNTSDRPSDLQFRAYAWRQEDGHERVTPTDDLIVSPPMVTVPPGGKQSFRVIRVAQEDAGAGAAAGGEATYRLKLNEIPHPGDANAIAINLEFSLPVFFGRADARARLNWIARDGQLIVRNDGAKHARLSAVDLRDASGALVAVEGARSAYVLAGGYRSFPLPAAGARAARTLVAVSDQGSTSVPLAALAAR